MEHNTLDIQKRTHTMKKQTAKRLKLDPADVQRET